MSIRHITGKVLVLFNVKPIITSIHSVKPVFKGHLNITKKMSVDDGCPFITDYFTWRRLDTVLTEKVSTDHRVSTLSQFSQQTGFTVIISIHYFMVNDFVVSMSQNVKM